MYLTNKFEFGLYVTLINLNHLLLTYLSLEPWYLLHASTFIYVKSETSLRPHTKAQISVPMSSSATRSVRFKRQVPKHQDPAP